MYGKWEFLNFACDFGRSEVDSAWFTCSATPIEPLHPLHLEDLWSTRRNLMTILSQRWKWKIQKTLGLTPPFSWLEKSISVSPTTSRSHCMRNPELLSLKMTCQRKKASQLDGIFMETGLKRSLIWYVWMCSSIRFPYFTWFISLSATFYKKRHWNISVYYILRLGT